MITKINNPVLDLTTPNITNGATFASEIDMGGNEITNLPLVPGANDYAASKFYVDQVATTTGGGVFLPAGFGPVPWAANSTVPVGWLLCDGEEYDSNVHTDLFAAIGTTYNTGGETAGFFRVPDMRGIAAVGLDDMAAYGSTTGAAGNITDPTADTLGGFLGAEDHTLTIGEMPSHDHGGGVGGTTGSGGSGTTGSSGDHVHSGGVTTTDGDQAGGGTNAAKIVGNTGAGGDHTHSIPNHTHSYTVTIPSQGSDTAHNILQPSRFFAWIIKDNDSVLGFPGDIDMDGNSIINMADPVDDQDAATKIYVDNVSPSGAVTMFAGSSAPTGWVLCDGAGLDTTTYADLFAIIGYTYGGSGSTFNVPDLSGRFAVGAGDSGTTGSTTLSLGDQGGSAKHQLTISEMPSHRHSFTAAIVTGQAEGGSGDKEPSDQSLNTDFTGGNTAHENMSPFTTLNYIIKT